MPTTIGADKVGNTSEFDFWGIKERGERKEERGEKVIDFRREVCDAYDRLAARYNPIVLEGAGSISELNLRDHDLVNLPMARHAHANVILVGDIDRGGIFASVYGSIALQTEEDRRLIKGIIINKFRGHLSLFEEGRRMMEEICGVPVLGVVPYFKDIHIEDEDSLSIDNKRRQNIPITSSADMTADFKEQQYDRLADHVRQHLDMDKLYKILADD